MPLTPSLPTWLAINNANFTSPTGLTDMASGQQVAAGGLNIGDYFDLTNGEASNASYAANGILYEGRYRLVQVDSGATASNVKTGTVGYLRAGGGAGTVKTVIITNAGTGATAGTYTVAASVASGGGTGAVIQVVVGAAGTITSVSVLNGGYGYNAIPTFYLTATGTTAGAVAAQLDTSPNYVTSQDQVGTTAVQVRPVVFLNSITPGNYGFIQELGTATLLAGGAITAANFVSAASTNGTVTGGTTYTVATVGQAIDTGTSGQLFKAILTGQTVQD